MNLKEKISNDLKDFLKKKDELGLSVLRMMISAIRNKEIAMRHGDSIELSDEQVQEVLRSEIKKRKDSIVSYQDAKREDLVKKEEDEMKIIEKYLPEQMSDEELEKIIKEVVASSNEKNFGKIMGQVMSRVKGQADGNRVGEMVKKLLA